MSNTENSAELPVSETSTVEQNNLGNTQVTQEVITSQQTGQPQQPVAQAAQPQQHVAQAAQPQQPVAQDAQSLPTKKKKKFGLFELIVGAVVVFGGGYATVNYLNLTPKTLFASSSEVQGGKVLIVNTDVLISAVSLSVMNDPKNKEKISILIEKIYQEINAYTKQGYIVLDSDTPILYSESADVTKKIAEKLGVDAEKGYKMAKENNFIGRSGSANLEVKGNKIANSKEKAPIPHEDYSNLGIQTNSNGDTMDIEQ